jgi:hypothetical protein
VQRRRAKDPRVSPAAAQTYAPDAFRRTRQCPRCPDQGAFDGALGRSPNPSAHARYRADLPRSRQSVSSPDLPAGGRHTAAASRCGRQFTSGAAREPRPCGALWPRSPPPFWPPWPTIAMSSRLGGRPRIKGVGPNRYALAPLQVIFHVPLTFISLSQATHRGACRADRSHWRQRRITPNARR